MVDPQALARRIEALNVLIRSHAGELQLQGVSEDGVVSLRYLGMCAGCEYRPVTTAGTVEPALLDLPGVTAVRVSGSRVSAEAAQRITAGVAAGPERAVRLVRRIEDDLAAAAATSTP